MGLPGSIISSVIGIPRSTRDIEVLVGVDSPKSGLILYNSEKIDFF